MDPLTAGLNCVSYALQIILLDMQTMPPALREKTAEQRIKAIEFWMTLADRILNLFKPEK